MNSNNRIWIVLGVIALAVVCVACGLISGFQSTQVTLLNNQQAVQRGQAQYEGALDIVTQKITGAFALADKQIAHEDRVYMALAEARKQYDNSLQNGTPADQVQAAQGFNLAFQALAEDNPEFASAEVTQDAMNSMEEAINEVFTAFQDSQDAVLVYNSYRGRLFFPLIVGDLLGFPRSFEYYEGIRPDNQNLIPATPAQ